MRVAKQTTPVIAAVSVDRYRDAYGLFDYSLVAVATVLIFTVPLLFNPRFYYYDDAQIQHLPAFYEMGRQIAHGEFPFVTLNAWYGGALMGEYQYGVLNPLNLLLSVVAYLFLDHVAAATIVSIVHLMVLTVGTFAAARTLACNRRASLIAAFAVSGSNWLFYWCAVAWTPGLVSIAWFPWMVASVEALRQGSRMRILPALAIFMPLASGWPHTLAAETLFLGFVIAEAVLGRRWRVAFTICGLVVVGFLLAMPSLLPLVYYKAIALRAMGWGGPIFAWLTPPAAWFGLGFPSFVTTWTGWGNFYNDVDGPMTYVCWALPMIAVVLIAERSPALRDRTGSLLIILTAIFVGLAMVPFPLPVSFKWSFRFIPYMHIFLMLWMARALTVRENAGQQSSGWSPVILLGCIAVPLGLTVIGGSGFLNAHAVIFIKRDVLTALLLFGMGIGVIVADRVWPRRWLEVVLGGQLLFFALILAYWPAPTYLRDWPMKPDLGRAGVEGLNVSGTASSVNNRLFLYNPLWNLKAFENPAGLGKPAHLDVPPWILLANEPLYYGIPTIGGYSPLEPLALNRFFCFGIFAAAMCSDVTQRLFANEPSTGQPYADLFKIAQIVVQNGPLNDVAAKVVPASWTRTFPGGGDTVYQRPQPASGTSAGFPRSGTLAFLPAGVQAELVSFSQHREVYNISVGSSYDGRPISFARPWYPGYEIRAGAEPLELDPIAGILVAARLPPSFRGTLEISYIPSGFDLGVKFALSAAAVLLAWSFLPQFQRRLRERRVPLS